MSSAHELTQLLDAWWGAHQAAELERKYLRETLQAQWQNVTDQATTAALSGAVDANFARIRINLRWELRLSALAGDVNLDVVWTDAPVPTMSDEVAAFQRFVADQILSARVGYQLAVDAERHALEVLRNHEDLVSLREVVLPLPSDGAWTVLDLITGALRPTTLITGWTP